MTHGHLWSSGNKIDLLLTIQMYEKFIVESAICLKHFCLVDRLLLFFMYSKVEVMYDIDNIYQHHSDISTTLILALHYFVKRGAEVFIL